MNKMLMFAMMFASLPLFAKDSPFACNYGALSAPEIKRHFNDLGPALRKIKTSVKELPDGYAFRFPNDPKTFAMLTEWIEQEHRCCPFFDIALRVERENGPIWMELTGRPGTKDFIKADGGAWITQ